MSVYKKILSVMKDVSYLQKDDSVEFKTTKYKAISEEKVTSAVGMSMREHGLVIIPVEQEHLREGQLTTVNVKYQIVDVDTGESIYAVSSGTGVDTQDKGVGKAMTYAYKYLLLRTFAIPTGEDPDKVSSAEWDKKLEEQQQKKDGPKKRSESESTKAVLQAKWETLNGGKLDGFEDWYKTKQTEGWTHTHMDQALTKRLQKGA